MAAQTAYRSPHDEAAAIAQLSSRASSLLVAKQIPAAAAVVAELRSRRPSLQTTQLAKPYDAALAAADTLGRRSAAIERRKARYIATRGPGKDR